jgi:sterol desaturase/sphingolipid hydroxylase (fatty acid hydroxylase superfamily)
LAAIFGGLLSQRIQSPETTGALGQTLRSESALQSLSAASLRVEDVSVVAAQSGYSGIEEKSGPIHSFVEHVMTYAFPGFCVANLYLALGQFDWVTLILAIAIGLPLAWVLADFVSGLVHWFADSYGADDTPLFGPWLIRPFRQHHVYPRDICTHGLVLAIGNSCTLAVPLQAGVLYLLLTEDEVSITRAFLAFVTNLFTIAMVATNVLHKWAHAEKTNWLISRLQRLRVFLSPAHHHLHHTKPFDSNYCITNGWLNPLLERIRFFRSLEATLSAIGIKPNEEGCAAVSLSRKLAPVKTELGDR